MPDSPSRAAAADAPPPVAPGVFLPPRPPLSPVPSALPGAPHAQSAEAVLAALASDPARGLTAAEVELRRARFGPNLLPEAPPLPAWRRFLAQFNQPLVLILIASGTVTAFLGEWVDSGVIFGVVLVNAIVGYLQEAKAVDALAALRRLLAAHARVVRDGVRTTVAGADLVPGDIVLLDAGDKVPADLRLIACHELHINEAMLTGESLPAAKHPAPLAADTGLADRLNLAYSGALVTRGTGRGVVVATGRATETGRISTLVAEAESLDTPFTRKIARFSTRLLWLILALAGLTFAVGVARGQPAVDMFMAAVALAVGAIPEGLPAAVTVVLAIGVKRMAARRAIVRKLPAVETLGGVTVICSDKTGTLTQNAMTVQAIWAGRRFYAVSGGGYAPQGDIRPDEAGNAAPPPAASADPIAPAAATPLSLPLSLPGALGQTLLAGLLCNDATLAEVDGRWQVNGDPTEGALLAAAGKAGLGAAELRRHPRRDVLPFDSQRQYMATLHPVAGEHGGHDGHGRHALYVKGAAERLAPQFTAWLDPAGHERPWDAAAARDFAAALARLAGQGLRVLAFARKAHDFGDAAGEGGPALDHRQVAGGLVLLGLQGMMDPPRPEAARAVAACRQAGVQVKMITGDHALTATAIARRLGLTVPEEEAIGAAAGDSAPGEAPRQAYSGAELAALDDAAFAQAARQCHVFARVEPAQKVRLVTALQAAGEVVAMTGDGVNDAPALKAADIGVAMGEGGTETARDAADMVLTDDNFATIVAAVEEGRGVFDNLTKFVVWTLPTNLGEGLVLVVAIVAGLAIPITPLQILWINMTTAVLLGLTLAFEPIEAGVMARPPRHPERGLVDRVLVVRILVVGLLLVAGSFLVFNGKLASGGTLAEARTLAANLFVLGETAYLFNCRSLHQAPWRVPLFGNPWLWAGVGLMLALQAAFTHLPLMNRLFGTAPLSLAEWGLVAALSLVVFVVVLGERWWGRLGMVKGGA